MDPNDPAMSAMQWDQIRVLTADNQRLSAQLQALQQHGPSADLVQQAPLLTIEPIAPLLPPARKASTRCPMMIAVALLVTGYICCVIDRDGQSSFDATYLYFQLVSTTGAGPVLAQRRYIAVIVNMLGLLALAVASSAAGLWLAERRAAVMFQLLSPKAAPVCAWAVWESLRLPSRIPVWLAVGIFSGSFPLVLTCEEEWNVADALYYVAMALTGTGLSDTSPDGPSSTGGKIVGILLAVGHVAILFCCIILLIDRCLASFALRVLQIAAGTPPAPLDAKVHPLPAAKKDSAAAPAAPAAARLKVNDSAAAWVAPTESSVQAAAVERPAALDCSEAAAGSDPEIESDHEECAWSPGSKTGEQGRDLVLAKRSRPQHSRSLGLQQPPLLSDAPELYQPELEPYQPQEVELVREPQQQEVQQVFEEVAGGGLAMELDQVKQLCERLGITYSDSRHEKLLIRLERNGVVRFEVFYRWLVKRGRKKYQQRSTTPGDDDSYDGQPPSSEHSPSIER